VVRSLTVHWGGWDDTSRRKGADTVQPNDKIPFTAHLEELRKRLIVCFIAIGIGFFAAYGFKEKLFEILMRPLLGALGPGEKLIFTGVPEAFFCYLKVAFLAGVLLAMPVIMYELWLFVAPGLYIHEKRFLAPIVILSSFFFVGGGLFGYFIVFPYAFKYLMSFASNYVKPLPSMKEYLSLASMLLLAFGLIFELPLFLTVLARMGIVSAAFLRKNRKYAILLAFVVGAILTPTPDAVNQTLMAGPLIVLYEVSILGARFFGKKEKTEGGDVTSSEKEEDGGET
jgi:sec-independent protein translocase protein TatC